MYTAEGNMQDKHMYKSLQHSVDWKQYFLQGV